MQISVWDDTAQRRASEGQVHGRHLGLHLAYLWAFPGICGHIGVPEHMPAYGHLGWPHAVMKNMGISGGKHTHIPTPTAHHCHYRRRFTLSEKKHCVLYVAISVFQPPFYHFYFFTYLKVFDFSLSKCAATSGCQGTDLVDFVLPNCFRTIRCHQQSGADGRSYPPPPTS